MAKIGPDTIKSVILKTNHLRYFSKVLCKYTLLKSDNLIFCLFIFSLQHIKVSKEKIESYEDIIERIIELEPAENKIDNITEYELETPEDKLNQVKRLK